MRARWIVAFDGDRPARKNWPSTSCVPIPTTPAAWGDMVARLVDGPPAAAVRAARLAGAGRAGRSSCPRGPYAVLHVGASHAAQALAAGALARRSPTRLAARGIEPVWSAGRGEEALVAACDPERPLALVRGHARPRADVAPARPARRCWSRPTPASRTSARVAGTPTVTLFGPGSATIAGAGRFCAAIPWRAVAVDPFPCRDQRVLFRREIDWVRRCGRTTAECARPRCMDAIDVEACSSAIADVLARPDPRVVAAAMNARRLLRALGRPARRRALRARARPRRARAARPRRLLLEPGPRRHRARPRADVRARRGEAARRGDRGRHARRARRALPADRRARDPRRAGTRARRAHRRGDRVRAPRGGSARGRARDRRARPDALARRRARARAAALPLVGRVRRARRAARRRRRPSLGRRAPERRDVAALRLRQGLARRAWRALFDEAARRHDARFVLLGHRAHAAVRRDQRRRPARPDRLPRDARAGAHALRGADRAGRRRAQRRLFPRRLVPAHRRLAVVGPAPGHPQVARTRRRTRASSTCRWSAPATTCARSRRPTCSRRSTSRSPLPGRPR